MKTLFGAVRGYLGKKKKRIVCDGKEIIAGEGNPSVYG